MKTLLSTIQAIQAGDLWRAHLLQSLEDACIDVRTYKLPRKETGKPIARMRMGYFWRPCDFKPGKGASQ